MSPECASCGEPLTAVPYPIADRSDTETAHRVDMVRYCGNPKCEAYEQVVLPG